MAILLRKFVFLAVLIVLPQFALASSVSSLSVAEVTDQSSTIFEGQVSGIRNVTGQGKGNAHTLVTFEVLEVIKGNPEMRTVELSFLGGKTANGRMMVVTDMNMPLIGERGIYFVENATRSMVHPLTGWSQGHFLVKSPLPGVHQGFITTQNGDPVFGLDGGQAPTDWLSNGKAAGVLAAPLVEGGSPLSSGAFKLQIREMAQ